ncbi:MAG: hypothetical protein A2275_07610 [Bacteroidetes bacterium RIFOXYA12_FULL_35_11]|nr:MAG: hypothetical protein A2X01_06865 [Bacteroidetes bacterium GWF2_35_48]OFY73855.1 MAG: hypothetical protein A2275_07610 [Bacteroidetes bacterium RIFOXYA12_FULL_35_11]OFZ01992.1 MAG: hypothetical protein A2491_17985 [Bacteroidetes bacterium RIFOXYC12_FULL_35_7]HBX53107.1 hypothetical protein [Bacteroidales bacterium]
MKFIKYFLFILFFLILVYFPVFLNLDLLVLAMWDESRLAVNAIEMYLNGNFLVTHYDNLPDLWNTKPPFLIWMQVLSFNIFGINELGVRFPSALAVLATIAMFIYFSRKYFQNFFPGLIASVILITTNGYINNHVSRTGDYDAMLALFTSMSALFFILYITYDKNKYLYYSLITLAFAVLTKGVAGMFFAAFYPVILILTKKFKSTLVNKHFYFSFLLFLFLAIGYYLLREIKSPGFFKIVNENELAGRFFLPSEEHQESFIFYFKSIADWQYTYWFPYLFVSLALLIIKPAFISDLFLKLIKYLFIISLGFLLIISFSGTKLFWYDAQVFTLLAFICAIPIFLLFQKIKEYFGDKNLKKFYVLACFVFAAIFFYPYKHIVEKNFFESHYTWTPVTFGRYMGKHPEYKKYTIVNDGYNAHVLFYRNAYNLKGYRIGSKIPETCVKNDTLLVCEFSMLDKINNLYNTEILHQDGSCSMLKIISYK